MICPDCNKEHSDAAPACPNCARPNTTKASTPHRPKTIEPSRGLTALGWIWIVLSILGAFPLTLAVEHNDPSRSAMATAVFFVVVIQGLTFGLILIRFAKR